jgi:hypothetical protein
MGATDAVQDLLPFLHLPLDQEFRLALIFWASHFPDGPFGFLAHGAPLPLNDKHRNILPEMNPGVYIHANYVGNNPQILQPPLLKGQGGF